jgi:hypothetical protein
MSSYLQENNWHVETTMWLGVNNWIFTGVWHVEMDGLLTEYLYFITVVITPTSNGCCQSPDFTLLLLYPINSVNIVQAQQSTVQA